MTDQEWFDMFGFDRNHTDPSPSITDVDRLINPPSKKIALYVGAGVAAIIALKLLLKG